MAFWFRKKRSPVKYKRNGHYYIAEAVRISHRDEQEAELRGKKDAQNNPFDVTKTKASEYEKELQKRWEKQIGVRASSNINRFKEWCNLIRNELKDLLPAKMDYAQRLKARQYSLSDSQLGKLAYVLILCIVTAAEIPINLAVFDIFGENVLFTGIMAVMLSFILALLAHFTGSWIKNEGLKIRSLILVISVFALIGVISWVRLKFFAEDKYSVIKDYFTTDIELSVVVAFFFIVNSLLFIVAIISSYHAHDTDPLFFKVKKRYNKTFKKVSNLFSACEQEINNLFDVNGRCQACFKELRHIYTGAYIGTGTPEPMCFKEAINVDLTRIPGKFEERLKAVEDDFGKLKQSVEESLLPIESNDKNI